MQCVVSIAAIVIFRHLLCKGSCELWFQIKYTQGDMEVARKYFGQAIKLNSNNMRALFGYYLVRICRHKMTEILIRQNC